MKKIRVSVIALALSLMLNAQVSLAGPDPYDDSQSHPLRIAAYLLYPAAYVTEWLIFRPFHFLVSATPAQAHPPREHDRRLRAFVTRVLADADAAGVSLGDLVAELKVRQKEGDRS